MAKTESWDDSDSADVNCWKEHDRNFNICFWNKYSVWTPVSRNDFQNVFSHVISKAFLWRKGVLRAENSGMSFISNFFEGGYQIHSSRNEIIKQNTANDGYMYKTLYV